MSCTSPMGKAKTVADFFFFGSWSDMRVPTIFEYLDKIRRAEKSEITWILVQFSRTVADSYRRRV